MQVPVQLDAQNDALALASSAISPPDAIVSWIRRLDDRGHDALLVGETALRLALGLTSNHYSVECSIDRAELLEFAPRAIPTGVKSGAWTLPTSAGPIDLHIDRSRDEMVAGLASQPFSVLALAFDVLGDSLIGSSEAMDDLACHALAPNACSGDDAIEPNFVLEAARLIATYGFSPTPDAMAFARTTKLDAAAREHRPRMRALIRDLLQGPNVREGLEWLSATGFEQALVTGVRPDAAALVAKLPNRLPLRMNGWLIGANAKSFLRDLRFGGEFSSKVYRFAAHHPIEQYLDPTHDAAINKLLRQLSHQELSDLFALRCAEAELLREANLVTQAAQIALGLEKLNLGIERVRARKREREVRAELALSGRDIMERLGCEPGPIVGQAIRFLEQCVANAPATNTAEELGRRLDEFRKAGSNGGAH